MATPLVVEVLEMVLTLCLSHTDAVVVQRAYFYLEIYSSLHWFANLDEAYILPVGVELIKKDPEYHSQILMCQIAHQQRDTLIGL